jgi:hypothetical protein
MLMPENGFLIDGMKVNVARKEVASPRKKDQMKLTGSLKL